MRRLIIFGGLYLLVSLPAGCGQTAGCGQRFRAAGVQQIKKEDEKIKEQSMDAVQYHKMKVDTGITYQTLESFGASGAWWSQYAGGFKESAGDSGISPGEEIAKLLFDRESCG